MFFPVPPREEPEKREEPTSESEEDNDNSEEEESASSSDSDAGLSSYPLDRIFVCHPAGAVSLCPLIITLFLAAGECFWGWGLLGLPLTLGHWFIVVGLMGCIAGGLGAFYRVPGALAGALCAMGAFGALWVRSRMDVGLPAQIGGILTLLAMFIGTMPGTAVYWLAEKLSTDRW